MTHTEFLCSLVRSVRTTGAANTLAQVRADRPAFDRGRYHDTRAVFYVWAVDRLVDAGLLGLSTVAVSANAQSARNCRLKEGEGGVLVNDDTKQPFTYQDACIALNPHVGGNPATAKEAQKAVSEFLQALLKLG